MNKNKIPSDKTIKKLVNDQQARIATVEESHLIFFHVYFADYVHYETAEFHKEIFNMTEYDSMLDVIVAFRESGKSSIVTTSYPLWAILGKQQKKFVTILSQTETKARQHLRNIRAKLEGSDLLQDDLGPFREDESEWGAQAIEIPRFDARIVVGSVEKSFRGLRHKQHRPDCVILDDVEDTQSVQTQDGRDKTWKWFNNEIIPGAADDAHIIAVGNLLHRDSLLKRMETQIKETDTQGHYKEFPIIDEDNKPLWPGKYPDKEAIEKKRQQVMNRVAWHREYLLEIIPDHDQIIHDDWIQRYDKLPDRKRQRTWIGVDPAVSKDESADYTAMVPIRVFGHGDNKEIYVLPNIVNAQLTHLETIERASSLSKNIIDGSKRAKLYVEDVAYQHALVEQLDDKRYNRVEGVKVGGRDKWARLKSVSHLFQDGDVYFPKNEIAERMIKQILGFGTEKYDDLVDGLTLALLQVTKEKRRTGAVGGKVDKIGSSKNKNIDHLNSRQKHMVEHGNKRPSDFE
jgi:predicted phage terminase large subunit-like protein